jgi:thiamine-monophosphate kinase
MKLSQVGEDRLLEQLLPSLSIRQNALAAAGDDCAVVKLPSGDKVLLLKTDCVVERIHFESATDPVLIGWKAMMRPLSDFAAMSGLPQWALVTLVVPATRSTTWVKKIYRGLSSAAKRFGVSIVGGETSNTRGPAVISVSVAGVAEKNRWVSRGGGKTGDDLFVTGRLGCSRRGMHLRFVPRIKESRWLTGHFSIHAMIDLSDGLGADLPRLARASSVGFKIDLETLPLNRGARIRNAISNGEDYELLFAVSQRDRSRLQRAWMKKFPRLPLTRIGKLDSKFEIRNSKLLRGYLHFQ